MQGYNIISFPSKIIKKSYSFLIVFLFLQCCVNSTFSDGVEKSLTLCPAFIAVCVLAGEIHHSNCPGNNCHLDRKWSAFKILELLPEKKVRESPPMEALVLVTTVKDMNSIYFGEISLYFVLCPPSWTKAAKNDLTQSLNFESKFGFTYTLMCDVVCFIWDV